MVPTPTDGRPLGPAARAALAAIVDATDPDEGLDRERATAVVAGADLPEGDADHAIEQLLKRGYCYAVDGRVFVTDRDVLD